MRISRLESTKPKNDKRIETVEGVAQAVYKRRKDIARFSGAQVDETGIGIGEDSVPVESSDRDWMFMPVLFYLCIHHHSARLGPCRLENVEHKIVKGRNMAITRVVGNRVYLKVNIKDEEQLYPLIEFLQNKIATPNNLLFDDFQFDKNQLSMRISRLESTKPKNDKRIETVEGVAQADSVPVESSDRDWMFMPVHLVKHRRFYATNITRGEDVEGKSSLAYQDLCRQRMTQDTGSGRGSKSSSTSSWCEEAVAQSSIDISTGHVILNFLQECLADPSKIEAQWDAIRDYRNPDKHVTIGTQHANRNRSVVPFDESLVPVDSWEDGKTEYLNASFIYDDDPRQPRKHRRGEDLASFWQAIWQHGVCLIVNLSTIEECKQEKSYWPESGSEVHGPFEVVTSSSDSYVLTDYGSTISFGYLKIVTRIARLNSLNPHFLKIHLVSEHIWSDDYLVRSFYLKNLRNGQTRTITQFHYLSWKHGETPSSPKSLIEFRRKVNKSYRGRASPVLVHSWDGAGRTGVFCAVDLLCGRLLKGVRQLDVVASVEHLRDQRDGLVRTADQFKLIYGCVAQEVNSLLKALPQ
ncbi:Protein-tyrosine phosphatase [Ostertagia ostertagi]